jgi:dihydroneopterin aldolase
MPILSYKGLVFVAPVGVYSQEISWNNRIIVDVELDWKEIFHEKAPASSAERVRLHVREALRQPSSLLEHVALDIIRRLAEQYGQFEDHAPEKAAIYVEASKTKNELKSISVIVKKEAPSLAAQVESTFVTTIALKTDKYLAKSITSGFWGLKRFVPGKDQQLQAWYSVDLAANRELPDLKKEPKPDLDKLINYERLALATQQVLDEGKTDFETIPAALQNKIQSYLPDIDGLTISVSQTNLPVGGLIESVTAKMESTFAGKCPRCTANIRCYASEHCFCKTFVLSERAKALLKQQYGEKCLCGNCLKQFGN